MLDRNGVEKNPLIPGRAGGVSQWVADISRRSSFAPPSPCRTTSQPAFERFVLLDNSRIVVVWIREEMMEAARWLRV